MAGMDPGSLTRGRFSYLPVAPGRLEFAVEVRRAILRERPQVVAVELPVTLEDAFLSAIARLPQITVIVYPEDSGEERAVYVPIEPADPFIEAVRSGIEIGAKVLFTDPDLGERPHIPDLLPDPYSLRHIGLDKYVEAYRVYPQPRSPEIEEHASGIAWKLQGTNPLHRVLVVLSLNLLDPVLDAMEEPQPEPRRQPRRYPELLNPHPDCLAEITTEYPYLQHLYEESRDDMEKAGALDRRKVQLEVFRDAEAALSVNAGETVEFWQRRLMARYTRNLALSNGELAAGLFDLTVAARSIVSDNYAWEVWQAAGRYPPQKEQSDLETVKISGEEFWRDTKRIRLRRRLPRPKQRLRPAGLKPRRKEKFAGEWAREFQGDAICSYPPEDIVIENYGAFLKKKAKSILSEERSRTEPFSTSLLDGVDLRETIRNWYEGKIYVRQLDKVSGDVGSVIVIFDPDPDNRYNYLTTWIGEHQNESDMAFYSTDPFEHIVGPGIGRAEYGGFLMSLPPRRMIDVWSDPDYDFAETKPERLLLAGLDYSIHKNVVYVAAKPPRSIFRSIAARFNRNILYIPIGQLSPQKLRKIRVVHVLDSHARRSEAKEYIW
ncbi:MAG TPA: hypothetical protein PLA43_04810 [Bryobacteraceae bacterium]|nr:hypothetical protein [Bryobacteraceae bacterium]HOQ45182.1 hypothetical protein [Bryobacteraceae bacterium]HPU71254.1 hypothetical protein [Bryobacteraceae bacterium]